MNEWSLTFGAEAFDFHSAIQIYKNQGTKT